MQKKCTACLMITTTKDKHSKTIMSKIDLSKAKVCDKFKTRRGKIMEYIGESSFNNQYILIDERDTKLYFYKEGNYTLITEHKYDLIEQVFGDEKDRAVTDKILKDVEKVTNGVAEAMPLIESAAIANLPREPLPENNEDDAELQRRQEVVELADRIFFSERGNMFSFKECIEVAEHSVNVISQYLKEGKL